MVIIIYQSKFVVASLLYIKEVLSTKRQQYRARSFIMLSCQIFGYFAYLTTLTYDNFLNEAVWNSNIRQSYYPSSAMTFINVSVFIW